jgi:hypothetical protein
MLLKSLFFLVLLNQFFVLGQKTNVVLPQRKIFTADCENIKFQDGSSIEIVRQSDENYQSHWSRNINEPQVFITFYGHHLYNYKAINDSRNICPVNFKVLDKNDLVGLNVTRQYQNSTYKYSVGDLELSYSQIVVDSSSCDQKNDIRLVMEPFSFIALKGALNSDEDGVKSMPVVGYHQKAKNGMFSTYIAYNSGLPIRCIEEINYEEYFSSILSYNELMPNQYINFIDSLSYELRNSKKIKNSVNIDFILKIEDGKISSQILKMPNDFDYSTLSQKAKKLETPFYKNINITTVDTISFNIAPNPRNLQKSKLKKQVVNQSLGFYNFTSNGQLNSLLNKSLDLNANAILKSPNNLVLFSGVSNFNENKKNIKKIVCPGPIYAIGSIIPGLGVLRFQNSISNKHSNPSKKLLISSLTIAGIGIASKFATTYQYNKFLNSDILPSDKLNSYKFANATQKVFVVSSAIYGALFLVDFTWTISLGIKSKHVQYQTNSELRKMHKKSIWI